MFPLSQGRQCPSCDAEFASWWNILRRVLLVPVFVIGTVLAVAGLVQTRLLELPPGALKQKRQDLNTNTTDNPSAHRRISLIVELRAGLGNQLGQLAGARMTQLLGLKATPPIHIELVGQLHKNDRNVRDDLVHCFPEFGSLNFRGGIYDKDFRQVQKLQKESLSEDEQAKLVNVRDLSFLEKLLERRASGLDGPAMMLPKSTSEYSLPYLTASGFAGTFGSALGSEELYHDLRHWFRFDEAACCNQVPDSEEVVFHFRNFLAELGRQRSKGNAYTEVTPETAARDVFFDHDHVNDTERRRVAIVSRFISGLQPYVDALQQEQGIAARLITDQSGVQDFCFITKARTELVCSLQSTFCRWASVLSNATVVRYYTLDQNQESSIFNSTTSRKRITSVKNVSNRTFVWEQYWQPDDHDSAPVTVEASLLIFMLSACIVLVCWCSLRLTTESMRIPKCGRLFGF